MVLYGKGRPWAAQFKNIRPSGAAEDNARTKHREYTYDETDWLILVRDESDESNPFTIY